MYHLLAVISLSLLVCFFSLTARKTPPSEWACRKYIVSVMAYVACLDLAMIFSRGNILCCVIIPSIVIGISGSGTGSWGLLHPGLDLPLWILKDHNFPISSSRSSVTDDLPTDLELSPKKLSFAGAPLIDTCCPYRHILPCRHIFPL